MARRSRVFSPVASIVLGVLVLLTPVVLTQVKNAEQDRLAAAYSASVTQLDQSVRNAMLERAHRYNESLTHAGRDPWISAVEVMSPAYRDYESHLDLDHVMARVKVASVGIDLPVYHGTSQKTLAAGVGHLYGTALPVGGPGTHAVLTGHTGLATMTMFDNLTHIKIGDVVIIEVVGESLAYRVTRTDVVLPEQAELVAPEGDKDLLTLITCTPYGINSHRLLVTGERLPQVPAEALAQHYRSPWQPWMIAVVVVSALALLYLVWWLLARRERRDKEGGPA